MPVPDGLVDDDLLETWVRAAQSEWVDAIIQAEPATEPSELDLAIAWLIADQSPDV
jgi:hypothetical protein